MATSKFSNSSDNIPNWFLFANSFQTPRQPVLPKLNVSSMLYVDTAHFYWSFEAVSKTLRRPAVNFNTPQEACNTSTTDYTSSKIMLAKNTGITAPGGREGINRCEKWPQVTTGAGGYFDMLFLENINSPHQFSFQGQTLQVHNPNSDATFCSKMYDNIYGSTYWSQFHGDLQRGLFDGNCPQEPCPRLQKPAEDCIVLNLNQNKPDAEKDCIYFGNFNANPEKFWQEKCFVNPSKCENGFSMSLWIKYNYTWLIQPNVTRFIIGTDYGSGNPVPQDGYITPDAYPVMGWGLWHYTSTEEGQSYLRVTVVDANYLYIQDVVVTDANGVIWPPADDGAETFWTNIGFRWRPRISSTQLNSPNIDVFVYGRKCVSSSEVGDEDPGCILLADLSNSTTANSTGVFEVVTIHGNASAVYLGCQGDPWGSVKDSGGSPTRFHYTSAVIDDVAFWAWRLRDEEIPYLLGGKAMPKENMNPDRAKSVDSNPEPVNPYYAMADIFYKLHYQDYVGMTYMADIQAEKLVGISMVKNIIRDKDKDIRELFPGRSDPRAPPIGSDSDAKLDMLKMTYASQLINSSSYIYVDPRIVGSQTVTDCPHELANCVRGFSLSIWVFIPSTASLRIMNDHYTIIRNTEAVTTTDMTQRMERTWELYTEGNHVFIRIGSATPVSFPGDCTTLLGRWNNLAFSYHPTIGIQTYINGLPTPFTPLFPQLTTATVVGSPAAIPNISHPNTVFKTSNHIIIGGDGFLSSSLAGMAFNDLAIWNQYIYPFETYKFLGLSEKEAVVLWNATQVWSADYFVARDRTLYWNKMGGMWLYPDIGFIRINVEDSDVKGHTVQTMNTVSSFLGLRDPETNAIFLNSSESCLVNPGLCDQSGATFGAFFLINQAINTPKRHYILTSGNVDDHCIGVAIWLEIDPSVVPNRVLYAEVSRYTDYSLEKKTANYAVWHISIPAIEIRNGTWYHFAITWSMDAGLYFFINGMIKAWASRANIVGVDSISDAKPAWRYDNRVMMGVNSFWDGVLKDLGYFSYETFAVYHKMFTPLELPKAFGLIENPWYGNATVWFDKYHLITQWQHRLYEIRLSIARNQTSKKYGYPYGITLTPLSARFNTPESISPIMYVNSLSWKKNMTVTMWFKVNQNISDQIIFSTDKYLDNNYAGGLVIRTFFDPGSAAVILEAIVACPDGTYDQICSYGNSTQFLGKWINMAVVFNVYSELTTCWLNGTQMIKKRSTRLPIPHTITNVEANATFVVGGSGNPQDFEIYQLAIYPSAMSHMSQLGLIMGMPAQEAIYLTSADYYWSFDGPAHDLFVPQGPLTLPPEASFEIDRRIQGRALKTNSTAKSCVNLGNFAGTCLTEVGLCNNTGFVVSLWIKLVNLQVNGYIFSTGGQQPGEPGVYVSLTQGILGVGVSNGTYLWQRLRIYIYITDVWFNLMFRWQRAKGLEVYVNGQLQGDDTAIGQAASIRNAQYMTLFTNATVGCSNSDMSKVVPIYVDDIWFKANYSFTPLTTDDCPTTAQFRNLWIKDLPEEVTMETTLSEGEGIQPYNVLKKAWATPNLEIYYPLDWKSGNQMDADKLCPGDLTKCPNGFTVSFWFMLPSLKKFSRALLQLRSSNYHGIQFFLDNQNLQQSLRVDMHNQTHRWLVTVGEYIETNTWLQLTAAWDTNQLTVYTLNRQYAPVYATKHDLKSGVGSDWSGSYSIGVNSDSTTGWTYYIEDLTVWNRYLENLKAYPMGVSCTSIYSDYIPDDLPTPPVLATSLSVAGVCYLMDEDGKTCKCTKEQWDRGAVSKLSSTDYFKILTMLQGKALSTNNDDDLGVAKYQPATSKQDLLSVKKQILNGAIMTLTDRTKNGLSKTSYDFVQLCSSVLYPIRSKETWESLADEGDNAMTVAEALEVFGDKVTENLLPVDVLNDTMNVNNSIDIHSDNIIFTAEVWLMEKVRENNFTDYVFPNYERIKLQSETFSKKWASDDTLDSISIPASLLYGQYFKHHDIETLQAVGSLYDTIGQMVPPAIDRKSSMYRADVKSEDISMISRVASLKFTPPIDEKESNDIRITLKHFQEVPSGKESFCAFYTKEQTWNTTGCRVINSTSTQTICSCAHLTNFAVLMQPVPFEASPIDDLVLSILSYVGLIISMLCLMTLFYLFVSKTKLHGERNTIHINLVIALFLANLAFLFTGPAQYFRLFCRVCAALMHYFYTATFMWLLMEGTYLFNAVVSGVIKGRLCCMIPLAWGVPVLVVAGVLAVDPDAYGGDNRCWLSFDKGFIFAFIGPIILIVIINAVLIGLIVYNMPTTVLKRDTKFYGKVLRGIRHAAVLLPLFGVTWLFGLFAVNQSLIVFQYLFVIFNSLQGFFIFLGFGWFQPDVRRFMCSRDDDMQDEEDPHKDVVNSESDLKTILSTMPPPTPELERKPGPGLPQPEENVAASFDISETATASPSPPPMPGMPPSTMPQPQSARPIMSSRARQMSAASARARSSFFRPATSLMRPKSSTPSTFGVEGDSEEPTPADDEQEAVKARELMDYLLDGKRVKDVPDFATGQPKRKQQQQDQQ